VLLTVLPATLILCALAVGTSLVTSRVSDLQTRITEYRKQTARAEESAPPANTTGAPRVESLEQIQALTAAEAGHYYCPGEISLSRFAKQIQTELGSAGLKVVRYRPVESSSRAERNSVEFVIRGDVAEFLSFLRKSGAAPHYRFFSGLAVRAAGRTGLIDATFRVGYEEKALVNTK